ncbi:cyclin-H-like [Portunus trituberculatus]|uniref:Cyclin-H n=1 Tax=Portunus trituberculatus TaxID=210409 RepID=A0A0S2AX50_PORTR|nr:cyclin-H-like [Portunus trituberculatus]XP_045131731.1 cyclin-H-like [Portunus trituberculatus]ALN22011.1 cyclin H [Portunus trituberculatus]
MYGSSTQFRSWTFKDEHELKRLRVQANADFIDKFGADMTAEQRMQHFLTAEEEHLMVRSYEHSLRDFCKKFRDPRDGRIRMLPSATTTAQHYFKRFYIYNSVMDYHPKEILVTCVYLACKIEEFYVTINDFVHNVRGDKKKAIEIILNNELQLTQELQFNLIIHQPFRPVEGLLIDIKTRFPQLHDPERLRPYIEDFLERVNLTDAILLYSPGQIALAAVTTAVSRLGENLDHYVTDILFPEEQKHHLSVLIEAVRKIKKMVKNTEPPLSDSVKKEIEAKLERCRNQQNNPNSSQYRANYSEWDDEDLPIASSPFSGDVSMGVERIRSPSAY